MAGLVFKHVISGRFLDNGRRHLLPFAVTNINISNFNNFYPSTVLPSPSIYFHSSSTRSSLSATLTATVSYFKQNISGEKTLKLISGSCCLPHPDKKEKWGEDAHFICADEQAIGVADGVGGWADVGVDAGVYSRHLMSNSVNAIQDEHKGGSIDLVRVLKKAHSKTKVKGSSTACIIALRKKGLYAINLGDSGFIVVRDGHILFSSPVQQHAFNFPYQLENGDLSDLPSSAQVFRLDVAPGDVIVAGTDGLFDNLFNNDIAKLVDDAKRTGLSPQEAAKKIAASALQIAQDKHQETPFSIAANTNAGGKLDDITVVISYINS